MRSARAAAGLAALLTTAGGQVIGDDVAVGRKARLEFRVVGTASGSGTLPFGSYLSAALEEGGSTSENIQVKLFPAAEAWRLALGAPASLCKSVIGIRVGPSDAPEGPLPLWQVEAVVRRAEMDNIVVGYVWKRRSESGSASAPEFEGRGEATLSEGGRLLLDYLPVGDASEGCYHNVALELSASIPEDPTFEDRRIGYDLWLVREDHAKRLTRRLQLIGRQGEDVKFDYGMFRSQLHGIPLPQRPIPTSDIMEMTVSGSVRSRIQPDGSIELLLVAHRTARPSDGRWATAASGEKRVSAASGETLRLELPPPASFTGVDEPDTFKAIGDQRVALVLTPTLVE